MEEKYGPQTPQVIKFLLRLNSLTDDDAWELYERRTNPNDVEAAISSIWALLPSSRYMTVTAVKTDVVDAVYLAEENNSNRPDLFIEWDSAAATAAQAAVALIARDVTPKNTYQLLTNPIVSLLGPLHVGDLSVGRSYGGR